MFEKRDKIVIIVGVVLSVAFFAATFFFRSGAV